MPVYTPEEWDKTSRGSYEVDIGGHVFTGEENEGLLGDTGTGLKTGLVQVGRQAAGVLDYVSDGEASRALNPWFSEKEQEYRREYSPETQISLNQYDRNVADAQARNGELGGFAASLGGVFSDPRVALVKTAEAAPSTALGVIPGVMAARNARLGVEALAAARTAAGKASVSDAIASAAKNELTNRAMKKAAMRGGAIGEGVLGMGGTMDQIVNENIAEGRNPMKGAWAAPVVGATTAATALTFGKLLPGANKEAALAMALTGSKTGAAVVANTMKPQSLLGKAWGATKSLGKSGLEEGAEEGTQGVFETGFQNLATDKPFTEGMGQNIGESAAIGAAMGMGMHTSTNGVNAVTRKFGSGPQTQDTRDPLDEAARARIDSAAESTPMAGVATGQPPQPPQGPTGPVTAGGMPTTGALGTATGPEQGGEASDSELAGVVDSANQDDQLSEIVDSVDEGKEPQSTTEWAEKRKQQLEGMQAEDRKLRAPDEGYTVKKGREGTLQGKLDMLNAEDKVQGGIRTPEEGYALVDEEAPEEKKKPQTTAEWAAERKKQLEELKSKGLTRKPKSTEAPEAASRPAPTPPPDTQYDENDTSPEGLIRRSMAEARMREWKAEQAKLEQEQLAEEEAAKKQAAQDEKKSLREAAKQKAADERAKKTAAREAKAAERAEEKRVKEEARAAQQAQKEQTVREAEEAKRADEQRVSDAKATFHRSVEPHVTGKPDASRTMTSKAAKSYAEAKGKHKAETAEAMDRANAITRSPNGASAFFTTSNVVEQSLSLSKGARSKAEVANRAKRRAEQWANSNSSDARKQASAYKAVEEIFKDPEASDDEIRSRVKAWEDEHKPKQSPKQVAPTTKTKKDLAKEATAAKRKVQDDAGKSFPSSTSTLDSGERRGRTISYDVAKKYNESKFKEKGTVAKAMDDAASDVTTKGGASLLSTATNLAEQTNKLIEGKSTLEEVAAAADERAEKFAKDKNSTNRRQAVHYKYVALRLKNPKMSRDALIKRVTDWADKAAATYKASTTPAKSASAPKTDKPNSAKPNVALQSKYDFSSYPSMDDTTAWNERERKLQGKDGKGEDVGSVLVRSLIKTIAKGDKGDKKSRNYKYVLGVATEIADRYDTECKNTNTEPTVAGLAAYLDERPQALLKALKKKDFATGNLEDVRQYVLNKGEEPKPTKAGLSEEALKAIEEAEKNSGQTYEAETLSKPRKRMSLEDRVVVKVLAGGSWADVMEVISEADSAELVDLIQKLKNDRLGEMMREQGLDFDSLLQKLSPDNVTNAAKGAAVDADTEATGLESLSRSSEKTRTMRYADYIGRQLSLMVADVLEEDCGIHVAYPERQPKLALNGQILLGENGTVITERVPALPLDVYKTVKAQGKLLEFVQGMNEKLPEILTAIAQQLSRNVERANSPEAWQAYVQEAIGDLVTGVTFMFRKLNLPISATRFVTFFKTGYRTARLKALENLIPEEGEKISQADKIAAQYAVAREQLPKVKEAMRDFLKKFATIDTTRKYMKAGRPRTGLDADKIKMSEELMEELFTVAERSFYMNKRGDIAEEEVKEESKLNNQDFFAREAEISKHDRNVFRLFYQRYVEKEFGKTGKRWIIPGQADRLFGEFYAQQALDDTFASFFTISEKREWFRRIKNAVGRMYTSFTDPDTPVMYEEKIPSPLASVSGMQQFFEKFLALDRITEMAEYRDILKEELDTVRKAKTEEEKAEAAKNMEFAPYIMQLANVQNAIRKEAGMRLSADNGDFIVGLYRIGIRRILQAPTNYQGTRTGMLHMYGRAIRRALNIAEGYAMEEEAPKSTAEWVAETKMALAGLKSQDKRGGLSSSDDYTVKGSRKLAKNPRKPKVEKDEARSTKDAIMQRLNEILAYAESRVEMQELLWPKAGDKYLVPGSKDIAAETHTIESEEGTGWEKLVNSTKTEEELAAERKEKIAQKDNEGIIRKYQVLDSTGNPRYSVTVRKPNQGSKTKEHTEWKTAMHKAREVTNKYFPILGQHMPDDTKLWFKGSISGDQQARLARAKFPEKLRVAKALDYAYDKAFGKTTTDLYKEVVGSPYAMTNELMGLISRARSMQNVVDRANARAKELYMSRDYTARMSGFAMKQAAELLAATKDPDEALKKWAAELDSKRPKMTFSEKAESWVSPYEYRNVKTQQGPVRVRKDAYDEITHPFKPVTSTTLHDISENHRIPYELRENAFFIEGPDGGIAVTSGVLEQVLQEHGYDPACLEGLFSKSTAIAVAKMYEHAARSGWSVPKGMTIVDGSQRDTDGGRGSHFTQGGTSYSTLQLDHKVGTMTAKNGILVLCVEHPSQLSTTSVAELTKDGMLKQATLYAETRGIHELIHAKIAEGGYTLADRVAKDLDDDFIKELKDLSETDGPLATAAQHVLDTIDARRALLLKIGTPAAEAEAGAKSAGANELLASMLPWFREQFSGVAEFLQNSPYGKTYSLISGVSHELQHVSVWSSNGKGGGGPGSGIHSTVGKSEDLSGRQDASRNEPGFSDERARSALRFAQHAPLAEGGRLGTSEAGRTDSEGLRARAEAERGGGAISGYGTGAHDSVRLDSEGVMPNRQNDGQGNRGTVPNGETGQGRVQRAVGNEVLPSQGGRGPTEGRTAGRDVEATAKSKIFERVPESLKPLAQTVLDTVKEGGLRFMFTRNFVDAFAKVLPSLRTWWHNVERLMQTRATRQQKAADIAERFGKLSKYEQQRVNECLDESTSSGFWPYRDKQVFPTEESWNDYLVSLRDQLPAYEAFLKKYNAMSKAARDSVKEVLDYGTEEKITLAKLAKRDAYRAIKTLVENARGERRTELANQYAKQVKDIDKDLATALAHPYAPFGRQGDHIVIYRSERYINAEKALNKYKQMLADNNREPTAMEKDALDRLQTALDELEQDANDYTVEFYESDLDANKRLQALRKQFPNATNESIQKFDKALFISQNAARRAQYETILRQVEKEMESENGTGSVREKDFKRMAAEIQELFVKSLSPNSGRKSWLRRKGIAGYNPNMMENFIHHTRATSHMIASMETLWDINDSLENVAKEARDRGAYGDRDQATLIANEVRRRQKQIFNPLQGGVSGKVMRVTSMWMLLTNPAFFLQNLLQPFMMSAPYINGRFKGNCLPELTKTMKDVAGFVKSDRTLRNLRGTLTDPEYKALMQARDRQLLTIGITAELGEVGDDTALGRATNFFLRQAQMVETINRVSTFLVAYREGIRHGLKADEAAAFAERTIEQTHGDYSKENAPSLFNENGALRMATQFRKFQFIQTGMMFRMMRDAAKGLTPEERAIARRQLAWTLMTHLAMAGVKGLPAANLILGAIAFCFGAPGDDDEDLIRRAIQDKGTSDLLLKGLPTLMGLDLSRKVGAGEMLTALPFWRYDPSEGKRNAGDLISNALGPWASLAGRTWEAQKFLLQGDYAKALEQVMPYGLFSNGVKAMRLGMQGYTNNSGDVLISPKDFSAWDLFGTSMGLTTSTMGDRARLQGSVINHEAAFNERKGRLQRDFNYAKRNRDYKAMAEAIKALGELNTEMRKVGYKPFKSNALQSGAKQQGTREKQARGGVATTERNRNFVTKASAW